MQEAKIIDVSASATPLPAWLPVLAGGPLAQARAGNTFDFGDSTGEALAALHEDAIFPLTQLGTLLAQGADVEAFLQGQFSNDIATLTPDRAQLSSYNSPKGRVIATLILTRVADGIRLETSAELIAALIKRLRMFVMRSKVQWSDLGASHPLLGISGPHAADLLNRAGLPVPATAWAAASSGLATVLRRPGAIPRFTVQAPADQLAQIWSTLVPQARAAGPQAWQLLDILAGQPAITAATQEHFVAQMLNLDLLSAISFTKGCYPGQEVVARLHYLGQLKRRMFLGFSSRPPPPGTSIYLAAGDGQAIGEVVVAAAHPAHPTQGAALLAVLQTQHEKAEGLRLRAPDGESLRIESASQLKMS